MATLFPFKPILPQKEIIEKVSTRSINTYTNEEVAELHKNPHSFIRIIQPDYNESPGSFSNSEDRFVKVKQAFDRAFNENVFQELNEKAFIIYQQKTSLKTFTGIIAGASTLDYENGKIKKHEETISSREKIFTEYLKICGFNAEPVLLTYPSQPSIDGIIEQATRNNPDYYFVSQDDKIHHSLWIINRPEEIHSLITAFSTVSVIYIADGHHRCASSYLLSKQSNEKGILSFLVSDQNIEIFDFNRVVKDLNGLSPALFLKKLEDNFNISSRDSLTKPTKRHHFTMYLEGKSYLLTLKTQVNEDNPIESLDAQLLTDFILNPILHISDLKTDNRIHFLTGKNGLGDLKNKVDSGKYKVGFCLFPVSYKELTTIADHHHIMPPKSTWIEPKLRTGLTIYKFNV